MQSLLTSIDLAIDDDELSERADPAIVIDERVTTLARSSTIGVWRGATRRHREPGSARELIELPLRCQAHPHPECTFRWAHLTVDFGETAGATVRDLSPRQVMGTEPVKITTRYTGGISLSITHLPLKAELSRARESEQDIYFPEITSSGRGFTHAAWTFSPAGQAPLHVDRDLHLLVSRPSGKGLTMSFTFHARLAVDGVLGLIPLVGRRLVDAASVETIP